MFKGHPTRDNIIIVRIMNFNFKKHEKFSAYFKGRLFQEAKNLKIVLNLLKRKQKIAKKVQN